MRKFILTACLATPLLLIPASRVTAANAAPQPLSGPVPNPNPPPPPPLDPLRVPNGSFSLLSTVLHIVLGM